MKADNSAWLICVLRTSMTDTIEMPIDEPMLRTRENSAVASVRKRASSVAKAMVDSGTKTNPSPRPWMMPEVRMSQLSICGEKPDIYTATVPSSPSPMTTSNLASTLCMMRPTRSIEIMVPVPRGAMTMPVVMVG